MSELRFPVLEVDAPADAAELLASTLWDLGATGIEERDASTLIPSAADNRVLLIAHFADDASAQQASRALGAEHEHRLRHIVGEDWKHAWKRFYKPVRVGERLVVHPPWERVDRSGGRIPIVIEPGNAFGSALHESTRLALGALERFMPPTSRVLDAGCGTGVLGIAALKLGARKVVGVDVDPNAALATLHNAQLNGVAEMIQASAGGLDALDGGYDLVVANIQAEVLVPFARALTSRLAPGGVLILSGLLVTERDVALDAYSHANLRCLAEPIEGDWLALVLGA